MTEGKITAVEWLQEQQKELLNQVKSGEFKIEDFEYYNTLYMEQAKEMEKEQKIEFANKYANSNSFYCSGEFDIEKCAEQYYNETFKSE